MTCSHWLMTQSVTSYIYHPDTGPGVFLVFCSLVSGRFGEHTFVYRQYGTLQVAAPSVRGLQKSERTPLHSIPCTALESAQPHPEVGAPGDVQYPHTVYREHVINVLVELE